MNRREVIRGVLVANWIMAGIAFSIWVYTAHNIYNEISHIPARAEFTPKEEQTNYELFRERVVVSLKQEQNQPFERIVVDLWGCMTLVCSGTAIGLMIGFPRPETEKRRDDEPKG